jgi:alkylhydroperoxidase family enzyme
MIERNYACITSKDCSKPDSRYKEVTSFGTELSAVLTPDSISVSVPAYAQAGYICLHLPALKSPIFIRPLLLNLLRPNLTLTRTHPSAVSIRTFTKTTTPKMRVPYAPSEPPTEEARPIYERIAERRKPRPLIPLDLALLHNPAVADGWNSFIGAIRTKTSIPDSLKELSISRVAVLNHAVHEWDVHAALALKAGVSKEVLQTLYDLPVTKKGLVEREGLLGFGKEEYAVLVYTDQMTVGVEVEDGVAEMVREALGDTGTVELTATIAAYNAVSRFLVALDVGECNGRKMKKVDEL